MSKLVINKYSVDKKELSVIFTFLCWLIVGFIVCFIGINNIFAASYNADNFTAQIYDNVNGTLTAKETTKETSGTPYYYSYDVGYTAYSSGGAWGVSSPIPLLANHTYSMTVDPMVIGCGFTILSLINRLGVGTSLGNAVTSYQNNTNVNEKVSQAVSNSRYLQYVFTPTINASYIVFPYSTTSSCSGRESQLTNIVIEDLGESGVSQEQINTSLNNQTNEINNSIQNSTNTITGEINDMENAIIDSNKETQEVIKDQFNSCRPSVNLFSFNNYSQPQADTTIEIINSNKGIVKLITNSKYHFVYVFINGLEKNTNYTFNGKFINSNENMKNLWFSVADNPTTTTLYNNSYSSGTDVTFNTGNATAIIVYLYASGSVEGPNEATWYDIQLQKGDKSTTFEPYGEEICSNKIDETNDKLNDLNSSLNDSNINGSLGDAGSFFDNFTTTDHGGLSGIITAPLVAINQMLNTSCNPMTTTFKGKELSLPCGYEFWNKMGPIQDFINLVLGGLLCYQIIIKLYKLIEKIKNPEDDRLEVMDL